MAGKGQLSATNIKPVYHIQLLLTLLLSQLFNYIFKSYHSKYHRKNTCYDIYTNIHASYTQKREEKKDKTKKNKKNEKLKILEHVLTKNYF